MSEKLPKEVTNLLNMYEDHAFNWGDASGGGGVYEPFRDAAESVRLALESAIIAYGDERARAREMEIQRAINEIADGMGAP